MGTVHDLPSLSGLFQQLNDKVDALQQECAADRLNKLEKDWASLKSWAKATRAWSDQATPLRQSTMTLSLFYYSMVSQQAMVQLVLGCMALAVPSDSHGRDIVVIVCAAVVCFLCILLLSQELIPALFWKCAEGASYLPKGAPGFLNFPHLYLMTIVTWIFICVFTGIDTYDFATGLATCKKAGATGTSGSPSAPSPCTQAFSVEIGIVAVATALGYTGFVSGIAMFVLSCAQQRKALKSKEGYDNADLQAAKMNDTSQMTEN